MTDWKKRMKEDLEPVLQLSDPRPKISAYDNMPYAIFRYPPEDEFAGQEKSLGLEIVVDTVHNVLDEYQPLDQLVLQRMPPSPDPTRDVVFIMRAGSLFPVYRTSSLLEQLMGTIQVSGE